MKINLISFILLTIISTIAAQQKQVCFTLDDLPFVALNHTENNFQTDATIKTLAILNNYKIPATGFVNE
ncbi:MAG: polysaccharide deacetylase-like protein, partial [Ignavibacteriae bacterium HGW-Ignavibacteriae-2]